MGEKKKGTISFPSIICSGTKVKEKLYSFQKLIARSLVKGLTKLLYSPQRVLLIQL
jgi:hypothetical protein